jgi:[protein-PII] uridylyltransferase
LESSGVEVQWARVATLGSSVVDSFSLVGGSENEQLRPDQRARVEHAVLTAAG